MSGAIRRSARNLQRLATQNSPDQRGNTCKRDYELNATKAMKGKLRACEVEYKVKATNRGGNQVIEFSAAMYELYRTSLVEHFETVQNTDSLNLKIEYKDITDKSNLCVESIIKVSGKDDLTPKYTINLYHTRSKVMVNGRDVKSFNSEHLKITQYILSNENVNLLDQELKACIIDGLKAIENNCTKVKATKINSLTSQMQITHNDAMATNTDKPDLVRHNSDNCGYEQKTGDEEQIVICPACDAAVEQGICCDLCSRWYHFECETLSDVEIEKFHETDLQYFCISCTYENQCQTLNDSILYSQSGVAEVGEETHPKTLDLSMDPISSQNMPIPTKMKSYDTVGTDLELNETSHKDDNSSVLKSIERACASNLNAVVTGSKTSKNRLSPSIMASRPRNTITSELNGGAGLLGGDDAIEEVVAGKPSDKFVHGSHGSAGSPNVSTMDCTNLTQSENNSLNNQGSMQRMQNAKLNLDLSQDISSGGVKALGGGTNSKTGKQTSRQTKKTDKLKLKEGEQEEQLKLARSLISNLERKVGELENTNRILRQDLIATSLSSNNPNNDNVHGYSHQQNNTASNANNPSAQVPSPTYEKDLLSMREHLRNLELDQMRIRILNIEQQMQLQNRPHGMQTQGHVVSPYINPHFGQWQGGSQYLIGGNPYFTHHPTYQGIFPVHQGPVYQNAYALSSVHPPSSGLNNQSFCTPQMAPMLNGLIPGHPLFYGPVQSNPNLQRPVNRGVHSNHNIHRPGHRGQGLYSGLSGGRGIGQHHRVDQRSQQGGVIPPTSPGKAPADAELNHVEIRKTPIEEGITTQSMNLPNSAANPIDLTHSTDLAKHDTELASSMSTQQNLSTDKNGTQMQRGRPTREHRILEDAPNSDSQTPEPGQAARCEQEGDDRKQKPFLGSGRASEQTAKRKSL